MPIHSKILIALLILASLGISGIWVGKNSIDDIHASLFEITHTSSPAFQHAADVITHLGLAHRQALEGIVEDSSSALEHQRDRFEQSFNAYQAALTQLQALSLSPQLRDLLQSTQQQGEVFLATVKTMWQAQTQQLQKRATLRRKTSDFEAAQRQLDSELKRVATARAQRMQAVEEQADHMVAEPHTTLADINDLITTLFQFDYVALQAAKNISAQVAQLGSTAWHYLNARTATDLEPLKATFSQLTDSAGYEFAVLAASTRESAERKNIMALQDTFDAWVHTAVASGELFDAHRARLQALASARRQVAHMNRQALALITTVKQVSSAAKQAQLQADAQATDLVAQAKQRLNLGLLGTLTCSLAISVLFYIRLTRPLRDIISAMRQLAQNERQVELTHLGRQDEIGQMSRALEVFKENAEHVQRLDRERQQQAREQRRLDEAAKAQERTQVETHRQRLRELSQEFGSVVHAASAGDFSARVDAEHFADESLHRLAHGVNELLDTVDRGIQTTNQVLSRMAEGDLTERMQGDFQGAFAELQDYINHTQQRLSALVLNIQELASHLQVGTTDIAADAQALSKRAESQAVALEETAVSLEEISSSVKSNASSARDVASLSRRTNERADAGREVVAEAVVAMRRIERFASEIQNISDSIQDITFQTNMLSLNAAVEASRAGDHGRGFAVVAVEVRSLAQRSSEAAKSISDLSQSSTEQIHQGSHSVDRTGTTFEEIAEYVDNLDQKIADISVATEQQATRIEAISQAITEMDNNTQQNSHSAEHNAALAQSLSQGAQTLEQSVRVFQLCD